jgi:hypothetical protein
MSIPFICLVILFAICVSFSLGFVSGSFWATIGLFERRVREYESDVGAPYPRTWE